MIPIENLKPFPKFCYTIGMIPSSYKESLTYEEQLIWFCSFLQDTVIPTVNNNGLAVQELQNLYVQLKNYVDTYFENLDVQTEIDNKLDDMAESGQLADIIADYIQLKGILAYNTVADMKQATNLVNGSFAETYGFYSVGDKGSAKYKIRTKTNEDIIDEMTVISLNDNSLIAELIIPDTINSMQVGIENNLETDISQKLNKFFNLECNNFILLEGTYYIDNDISLKSNSNITFEENAKIVRITTSNETYFMVDIDNCENVTINNAHLIGDKETHTGQTGEWGYGFNITGSKNITLNNCIIEKTWGDGVYIGYKFSSSSPLHCEDIYINNCKVLECSRNGFSLCAVNHIRLNNCYAYGITRTDPKAGIDIETEGPEGSPLILSDIEINNFTSEQNTLGIAIYIKETNFESFVINNHISIKENTGFVTFRVNGEGNILYQNASVIKPKFSACMLTNKETSNNLVIKNLNVDSRNYANDTHNLYGVITINNNNANNGNITIDGITYNKTFTDMYDFQDMITEVGNGTLNNLILKNIITDKYLCLNNTVLSSVKLTNCEFISNSTSSNLNVNKNRIFNVIDINTPLTATPTYRNIGTDLPDGYYKIRVVNNTQGYFFRVLFDSSYTVYKPGVFAAETNKEFRASHFCLYMYFVKKGNNVYVLETSMVNS